MITKKIKATVYLEGVLVNFNSVQINEQHKSPPRAIITFPADSAVLTLLPKTIAEVYYEDDSGKDVLIFMGECSGSQISFSSDKRVIAISFTGLTQNWMTNPVLSQDVKIRNLMSYGLYAQVMPNGNSVSTSTINFLGISQTSPLDAILVPLTGYKSLNPSTTEAQNVIDSAAPPPGTTGFTLPEVLAKLIDFFSSGYNGIYWANVASALKFNQLTAIDDSTGNEGITNLIKNVAVIQHLMGLANGTSTGQPIAVILNTILEAFGFEFCEMAAPSDLGSGKRAQVLIKPQTHFFPPIRHNLVVDDNIAQLNFTRDFDQEPTRLVGHTVPFYLQGGDDLGETLISVVVPKGIRLSDAVQQNIDTDKKYEDLKMWGLSTEEQCRGVIVADYEDKTQIENAYLIGLYNDPNVEKTLDAVISGDDEKLAHDKRADESGKYAAALTSKGDNVLTPIEKYHVNVALSQYYDRRHAARTTQVSSTFSPYRMVGFPGVVVSKYFPKDTPGIIGNLEALTTIISADGDANQTLVFSHCRFVGEGESIAKGFLDDAVDQPIPWYADYVAAGNINRFYQQFTGVSDKDPSTIVTDTTKLASRIVAIRDQLSVPNIDHGAYILEKTQRPLVSKETIRKLYPVHTTRSLSEGPGADGVFSIGSTSIYVTQRRERVGAIFKLG